MNQFARGLGMTGLCVVVLLTLSAASATAQVSARRRNWLPSGNTFPVLLGDQWSFKCPAGGTFWIWSDTMDDNANGTSNLDMLLEVVDAKGNIVGYGDEEWSCTFAPTCGFVCPYIQGAPCGSGTHTVAVANYPSGSCTGGGGYSIELMVFDKKGNLMTDSKTAFGGGAKIKAPKWAVGLGKTEPVVDDAVLASIVFPIPDPTFTALETEVAEADAEEEEALESDEEAARNSEERKAEALRTSAAKRGQATPPQR